MCTDPGQDLCRPRRCPDSSLQSCRDQGQERTAGNWPNYPPQSLSNPWLWSISDVWDDRERYSAAQNFHTVKNNVKANKAGPNSNELPTPCICALHKMATAPYLVHYISTQELLGTRYVLGTLANLHPTIRLQSQKKTPKTNKKHNIDISLEIVTVYYSQYKKDNQDRHWKN